jgi:hypothetical protein
MKRWKCRATIEVTVTIPIERILEAETPEQAVDFFHEMAPTADELRKARTSESLLLKMMRIEGLGWTNAMIVLPAED